MDIYQHTSREVEEFVRSKTSFLGEKIRATINPNLTVKSVSRNPNHGERNSIYDLQLSDSTKIVLKLSSKECAEREVEGMNYATATKIPSPRLICYDPSNTNSLQNAFLLMDYVDILPSKEMFMGDCEINKWGKTIKLNKAAVRKHVREASDLCLQTHQVYSQRNPTYTAVEMNRLFEQYNRTIKQKTEQSNHDELLSGLNELFSYYETNITAFSKSPAYHLHGDLDPTNIPHTKQGTMFIDWGNYHIGDCAEDIAYFIERNLWIPEDFKEQLEYITENYSKIDSTFGIRLGFHLPLTKLRHVLWKGTPKEEFLEAIPPKPF